MTPESGLVLGEILMTLTLEETKLRAGLIKVTDSETHQGHGIHFGAVTKELHERNLICLSKLFICHDHMQDYSLLSHVFCFYASGNYPKHLYYLLTFNML